MPQISQNLPEHMRYLLLVIFCLVFMPTWAQFIPMQQTIKTPYGPAKITTYTYHPMPYRFGSPDQSLTLVFKTNMTIIEKDGTVKNVRIQYDASSKVHVLKELGNKKTDRMIYKPADTKQISCLYMSKLQVGIPADSCWLFKIAPGKIVTYSFLPSEQDKSLAAIQDGKDGPILPLTKENLLMLSVDANERVYKLIEEQKYWKAISLYNKLYAKRESK